jgi:hypothetical protein
MLLSILQLALSQFLCLVLLVQVMLRVKFLIQEQRQGQRGICVKTQHGLYHLEVEVEE